MNHNTQIPVFNDLQELHPALWRASQLAHGTAKTVASGYMALNQELPDGGWPLGQLTEILTGQEGTAELRLLMPALKKTGSRPLALLAPPYTPQAKALLSQQLCSSQLLWIACDQHTDSLWAAEQILRHGSCGSLLFWQPQIRTEALRRLHLAAQASETLFCLIRPLQAASSASPAPLRVSVRPTAFGLQVHLLKRRGALREAPLPLYLPDHPYLSPHFSPRAPEIFSVTPARAASVPHTVSALFPAHAQPKHAS